MYQFLITAVFTLYAICGDPREIVSDRIAVHRDYTLIEFSTQSLEECACVVRQYVRHDNTLIFNPDNRDLVALRFYPKQREIEDGFRHGCVADFSFTPLPIEQGSERFEYRPKEATQ